MTDFEICKHLRKLLLNMAAQVIAYQESWSAEFYHKELTRFPTEIKEKASWYRPVNVNNMNKQELEELGFERWTEESEMLLIPLWIHPFLQEEIDAESISGEKFTKVSELDTDNRYGMMAYGVYPKEA